MSAEGSNVEVFVYTGPGGERVPDDVERVLVDPSVTSIPAKSFERRRNLTEVELSEGIVELGEGTFAYCGHSITKIKIPNSLRRICDDALLESLRTPIRLHDDIESIGECAFNGCIFTNFRAPPLITVIPKSMLARCKSMFSVELPESLMEVENYAFNVCYCIRNIAFPTDTVFSDVVFIIVGREDLSDLCQLFGSQAQVIIELQHRFDGLPVHKLVYYQSYNQGVLQMLIAAINMTYGQRKLDPTGNQQDCLGMTPLHILTCSSIHDLKLYRVIVEKYPANLITEDRWGALPLLYAFWGAAPTEIIQFLVDSYQLLYSDHVFNWTMMVETMGRCETPKERIENLLHVRQLRFPGQPLDWDRLLDEFALRSDFYMTGDLFQERIRFFFLCSMSERVEALAFKVWRDHITNMIQTSNFSSPSNNSDIMRIIRYKLAHFEDELSKLKHITTILELALWKMKMNEKSHQDMATQRKKKMKANDSSIRGESRVTCGADVVIGHVLPFLVMAR
jgi:hypothetical protein